VLRLVEDLAQVEPEYAQIGEDQAADEPD
jgi:hypothetical protein